MAATRITPDHAEAHFFIGYAYTELERYHEAIEAYRQAISIEPDYVAAHSGLGMAYVILGDKDSALEEYNELKNLDEDAANMLYNLIYKV